MFKRKGLIFITLLVLILPILSLGFELNNPNSNNSCLVESPEIKPRLNIENVSPGRDQLVGQFKYSKVNNFVLITEPSVSCEWRSPSSKVKYCSVSFEWEPIQKFNSSIAFPIISIRHFNSNFSNSTYTLSGEKELAIKSVITYFENGSNIENKEYYNNYVNYNKLPSTISLNHSYSLKEEFTIPLYELDQVELDLEIAGTRIQIDPNITACGSIAAAGVYNLTQDVAAAETCFSIDVDDVKLDGKNFNVTYDQSAIGSRYGVIATSRTNVTITNMRITEHNDTGSAAFPINIAGTSRFINISNVTLASTGSVSRLINFALTRDSWVSDVRGNMTGGGEMIYFGAGGSNNTLSHLNLRSMAGGSPQIYLFAITNTTFYNITTTGAGNGIVFDTDTNNTLIELAEITSTAGFAVTFKGRNYGNTLRDINSLDGAFRIGETTSNVENNTFINIRKLDMTEIFISDTSDVALNNFFILNNSFGMMDWIENGTNESLVRNMDIDREGTSFQWNYSTSWFIDNNTISLNMTNVGTGKGRLNGTVEITMRGLNFSTNVTNIFFVNNYTINGSFIRERGTDCIVSGTCTLISYDNITRILVFNTTQMGSFSANGSIAPLITLSQVNLLLDGTDADITVDISSTVNITAIRLAGNGNIVIRRNGTIINNISADRTENLTLFNSVGHFNITAVIEATSTFSSVQENHTVIVTSPPITYDLCLHTLTPGKNCTMSSHVTGCGVFQYSVYNMTETLLNNNALTHIADGVYELTFNFTTPDSYIVRLCDNSTQTVLVKGDEDSMSLAVVFGLILFVILFIVLAIIIENVYLKLVSIMVSMGFSWVLYGFILRIAEDFIVNESVNAILLGGYKLMVYSYLAIFSLIICYMLAKTFLLLMEVVRPKKKN